MPPHTTKRRTTTNLKTKSNQNSQKIELYGSLIMKKLMKKHSSRLVGRVKTGSHSREDVWQGGGWRTKQGEVVVAVPHSHADKPGGTTGE